MAKTKSKEKCRISLEEINNGWKVCVTTSTETISSRAGWIPTKCETEENSFPDLKKALAFIEKEYGDCDKK